ncbi:hypothetical protein PUR59_02490 [Streptomyces sp. SP18ES09]|uniref:hypothetical protein n=1 Tax=Streptomyces sp. SP18ES09 TaxID=3002532 RepID=UPI002E7814E7|nr:hypothetical protein [Streptomyces sp. SP18ES09]MEE1813895.1 hypothetical protein [Streptomyces sp. SP18ES09]
MHPEFDRRQVVEWLLTHDKIAVPTAVPLTVGPSLGPGVPVVLRMDDPRLDLSDDQEGEDHASGWMTMPTPTRSPTSPPRGRSCAGSPPPTPPRSPYPTRYA